MENSVYPDVDLQPFFTEEKPLEALRHGAERYAPLRKSATGSWRYVLENLSPVAVVWTDWEDGFDLIPIKSSGASDRIGNYIISSKAHKLDASWAYTTLETFVGKFHEDDGVSLSPSSRGKLSGAQDAANGKGRTEDGTA